MCAQVAQKCALIDLKTGNGETRSRVRIPPSPPYFNNLECFGEVRVTTMMQLKVHFFQIVT
jgi:hypothetical protein